MKLEKDTIEKDLEFLEEIIKTFQKGRGGPVAKKLNTVMENYKSIYEELNDLETKLEVAEEWETWSDKLAETLTAVNSVHGGRHAARLLKYPRRYDSIFSLRRK